MHLSFSLAIWHPADGGEVASGGIMREHAQAFLGVHSVLFRTAASLTYFFPFIFGPMLANHGS